MRTHTESNFLPKFAFSLENNAFSYFKKCSDFSYAKQNLNIKLYFFAFSFFSLSLPVEPFGNINFIVQHRQRKQLCVIEWVCFAHVCIEIRILSSSLHCFVKCSIFSSGHCGINRHLKILDRQNIVHTRWNIEAFSRNAITISSIL